MALVRTTNSAAIGAGDTTIVVASASGFAAGYLVRVGDEQMRVAGGYNGTDTIVPVIRGQEGTRAVAHGITTGVVCGSAADWAQQGAAQTPVQFPLAGRSRTVQSYGTTGAITLPPAGADALAIINGTSALAMTVAAPGKDIEGSLLWIASNGVAAHSATFSGGISGAATGYTTLTVNATAPVVLGPFMAVNEKWQCPVAVPMTGTTAAVAAAIT